MNHIFASLFYVQYFHWLKITSGLKIYMCVYVYVDTCKCLYMSVCMYVCVYIYICMYWKIRQHMNGVAIVICVNITMSCLYQIVPYMCSMYPLSMDNKKIKIKKNKKLSAKYFIDVLMIWICLVIITFINHKISLGVTILDPSRHIAYSRTSIISHLKTQK